MRLFNGAGRVLATRAVWLADNDARQVGSVLACTSSADFIRRGIRDAAIVLELPAGAYAVMMQSTDETVGCIGLVEVDDLSALPEV